MGWGALQCGVVKSGNWQLGANTQKPADQLTRLIIVHTLTRSAITFDAAKDRINSIKHGVSLAEAGKFEWDTAVTWLDARRN